MQLEEIQSWVERLSQDEAKECLTNLQGLASQLNRAMDAIENRQLPSLQSSVQLQSMSCASLSDIRHRSNERLSQSCERDAAMVDSDLAAEIKSATRDLLTLNRRYAALLKHSGKTLQLLAGLYRSYPSSRQSDPGISGNFQTWSCEV